MKPKDLKKISIIQFLSAIHLGMLVLFFFFALFAWYSILAYAEVRSEVYSTGIIDFGTIRNSMYGIETDKGIPNASTIENPAANENLSTSNRSSDAVDTKIKPDLELEVGFLIAATPWILVCMIGVAIAIRMIKEKNPSRAGFILLVVGALTFPFGILSIISGALTVRLDPELETTKANRLKF